MTTTYTPGPWTVNGREIVGPDDSGAIVARLPDWGILADGPDPAPANAALIAAAPAMLAALQRLTHPMADDTDVEHALAIIAGLETI